MNYFLKVSLNTIAACVVAMAASYLPEQFPQVFGDWSCQGCKLHPEMVLDRYQYIGCQYSFLGGSHGPTTHWGYRHWIWFFMGLTLFCIQIVRITKIKYDVK